MAAWTLPGSDFPKQALRKSVRSGPAVLREAGEGGQLAGGDVPGLPVSPLGRAPVGGQGAVSARELDLMDTWKTGVFMKAAGVPELEDFLGDRHSRSMATGPRRTLALEMVGPGTMERGYPPEGWMGCGGRRHPSGCRRYILPGGPGGLGDVPYVLDVPFRPALYGVAAVGACQDLVRMYRGFGRPRKPRLRDGQRRTMEQRCADELPEEAWREIPVAEGSQGPAGGPWATFSA